MPDFEQILKRAHIQQLRAYLLEGADFGDEAEHEDSRPYEQRLREEEGPVWELLETIFQDEIALDAAAEKLNRALVVNQSIFMEIGIKAGAILLLELLRETIGGGSK